MMRLLSFVAAAAAIGLYAFGQPAQAAYWMAFAAWLAT